MINGKWIIDVFIFFPLMTYWSRWRYKLWSWLYQWVAWGLVCVVCVSMYMWLLFAHRILWLAQSQSVSHVMDNLIPLSLYTRVIDPALSQTLFTLYRIQQTYASGKPVFDRHRDDITAVLDHITRVLDSGQFGFLSLDPTLRSLLDDIIALRPEIEKLLGADGPRRYIVLLQNSAEKRPNGWFFGSFAFIEVDQWRLVHLRVIDSYFPNWLNPQTVITAPQWTRPFIPDGRIWFIAANKFGFTDKDGANIKNLFDHIFAGATPDQKARVIDQSLLPVVFDKKIDGVIFVHSDKIAWLLPWLQAKLWERQFVNAASTLIKQQETWLTGERFSDKKSLYLAEVERFFLANRGSLFRAIVDQAPTLLMSRFIQLYLDPSVMTPALADALDRWRMQTRYSSGFVYLWDTNDSENKIDTFVTKKITITDSQWQIVRSIEGDVVPVDDLPAGEYDIRIRRRLDIPVRYTDYIRSLEQRFGISLTPRELGILALGPTRSHETGEERRWSTRSQGYLPVDREIVDVVGDIRRWSRFDAPFAHGVLWHAVIEKPGDEIGVRMTVKKK